jgi:hypothetical protein
MHMGTVHVSGDHLRLPSLPAPDTEARQKKVREMQHLLVLKHPDAIIVTSVKAMKHLKHS